jgi:hypothetical protein
LLNPLPDVANKLEDDPNFYTSLAVWVSVLVDLFKIRPLYSTFLMRSLI